MKKVFMFSSVHKWNDTRVFHKEAVSLAKEYFIELHAPADFKYNFKYGVHIQGLPRWSNRKTRIRTLFILIKRILRTDADIFHFHDLELIPLGFLLKFMNKKVIYDIHESNSNYILIKNWIPKVLRLILSNIVSVLENLATICMDAIIVTSIGDFESFKKYRNKIILYNFPISQIFDKNIKTIKKYDIIYHGTITFFNFNLILDCVKKLIPEYPNFKCCLIIGDNISLDLLKYIDSVVSSDTYIAHFEIFKSMDYLEIPYKLVDARIGIIPLPKEKKFLTNIPTKLFEFMLCGIPVVSSDLPPIRSFYNPNKPFGILVDPISSNEFARAIKKILDNKKNSKEFSSNGYTLTKRYYTWRLQEKKLLTLYSSIIYNMSLYEK